MKKAHDGTPTFRCRAAKTGNHVPRKEPTRMTKMDEMRTPMRPSKSLSVGQSDMVAWPRCNAGPVVADDEVEVRSKQSRDKQAGMRAALPTRLRCLVATGSLVGYMARSTKVRFRDKPERGRRARL